MEIGSLVKRKPLWGDWVDKNPWMKIPKELETGIIIQVGRSGYWDYEVLWLGEYASKHDESELEEIK